MQIDSTDRGHPGDLVAFAGLMLRTRGGLMDMCEAVETDHRIPPRVARIVHARAAAPAGATASGSWGAAIADAEVASRGFLDSLRGTGIFDRLLADMRPLPMRIRAVASTEAISGSVVSEDAPKPISTLSLANQSLIQRKVSTIVAVSDELAEAGGPEASAFLEREMRKGTVAATDRAFLDEMITSASPPLGASAGATAADMRTDLGKLLAAVHVRGGARLYFVCGIAAANGAAVLDDRGEMGPAGGMLCGLPALVTDAIATDAVMLVNAGEFAANGGMVELGVARHASVQLRTDPETGQQQQISLWQAGARAIRCERVFGFERLYVEAAAMTSNVGWAA
jgi:hypothetical protein